MSHRDAKFGPHLEAIPPNSVQNSIHGVPPYPQWRKDTNEPTQPRILPYWPARAQERDSQRPLRARDRKPSLPNVKLELAKLTRRPKLKAQTTPANGVKISAEARHLRSGKWIGDEI